MIRLLASATLSPVLCVTAMPVHAVDHDTMYQVSTLAALQVGLYQPAMSVGDLLKHGDVGLGTYEGLDGEMVVNGGSPFQVPFSGRARPAKPGQQTPFAVTTFFDVDERFWVRRNVDLDALAKTIDARIASSNYFYAIKVRGRFDVLQTRSVRKQSKPYQPLADAVAGQRVFDLRGIRGTMVGIRSPDFVGSMNVPGYHWHFISADGTQGGHVLAMSAAGLSVRVDETRTWKVVLPKTRAFGNADLG